MFGHRCLDASNIGNTFSIIPFLQPNKFSYCLCIYKLTIIHRIMQKKLSV